MLRILHTADLHVGTPLRVAAEELPEQVAKTLRQAVDTILARLVDYAIDAQVDAVMIVGDLFDGTDPPVSVQYDVYRQFRRLANHGIPVVLTHGNHDPAGAPALFQWPDSVHVLGGQAHGESVCDLMLPLQSYRVQFSGFSYGSRELYGSKVGEFHRLPEADIAIAMYHGQIGGSYGSHAPYAAAPLEEVVRQPGFDAWALGHIHRHRVLRERGPFVGYPGAPQGRDVSEMGPHGAILLTWDDRLHLTHTFLPFSTVEWQRVDVDVSDSTTIDDVWAAVAAELKGDTVLRLVHLCLSGRSFLHNSLNLPEAKAIFQHAADDESLAVWIHRYTSAVEPDVDFGVWETSDSYVGQLLQLLRQAELEPEAVFALLADGGWKERECALVAEALKQDPEGVMQRVRQILLSHMHPEKGDLELVEWRGMHAAAGSVD
ncbi:metallophosphoesterase family protein [Alicyclobacillus acidoterrestris]|uniref:DNA repair exonuclease n=1 Tax=Alicyclobacillus acidoterrestris (strain ATCC 49025 / DSM 3922 / CIP 106132 / NCIMB 13137 / GD3B) TaxID=1356854 RepID=T0BE57_ALIAG|nr:DNA repair exonuclease [Alicyclobacillus acidoterrestris]EPZ42298.1 hypothetical protein N007_15470 [Alicyclobacillus acidoterrestris ATCC 49025]UNO48128.1 DNA repair exonuclease [Alicyclobacillus acidoterrestris]